MPRRFLIADDHPLYLEAVSYRLRRLFPEAEIVACDSFDAAVTAAAAGAPLDLLLCDLRMPGSCGAGMVGELARRFPEVPVAIMSGAASDEEIRAVIAAGARGFLPKTMSPECFAAAINILILGGSYLPAEIIENMTVLGSDAPPPVVADRAVVDQARAIIQSLTPRERDVLSRVAGGLSNKAIGRELDLAEITVKLHVRQILRKAGVRNRSAAAATAIRAGLA